MCLYFLTCVGELVERGKGRGEEVQPLGGGTADSSNPSALQSLILYTVLSDGLRGEGKSELLREHQQLKIHVNHC